MANAQIKEVLPVSLDALYQVITDYAKYPEFVEGCTDVQISRDNGKTKVKYKVSMIKDIWYELDHTEQKSADGKSATVSWTLIDSDMFKVNNGKWILKAVDEEETEATYDLEVEFKIPVPSLILNKLVKGNLPSMVKSFRKRAEAL